MLFLAPPDRFVPSGMPVVALVMGALATAVFYVPIYGVADLLRRFWQLPPWAVPLVAAAICFFIGYLICFGLSHDPALHSASGLLYYGGAVLFLPSLLFGIPYTLVYYVKRPRNTQQDDAPNREQARDR
jgi:hypothetical protein